MSSDEASKLYKRPNFLRTGASGRRRALLVGLNYAGLPKEWEIPPLAGCINDVFTMTEALKMCYGFQQHDIRMLVDSDPINKPTREMFLRGLKWLVEGTRAGDTSVFYYAGHGSTFQVPFTKQPDDYACLCLSDGLLLLSEIWNETQMLPRGCCFACIMDTSFAQDTLDVTERTLANVGFHDPQRNAVPSVRFLPPRKPPAWFSTDKFPATTQPKGAFPHGANGFVLAASGSNQVALEVYDERKNRVGGFFTVALELTMKEFLGRPGVVKAVFHRTQEIMEDVCCVENLEIESQVPVLAFNGECPPETTSFMLPLNMYTNHTDFRHRGEEVNKPRPPYVRTGEGSYGTPGSYDKKADVGPTGRPLDQMVSHVRIVSPVGGREMAAGFLEATQRQAAEQAAKEQEEREALEIKEGKRQPPPESAEQQGSYFDTMKSYFTSFVPGQAAGKPEPPPPAELELPPGVLMFYDDQPLALQANGEVVVREGASLETPVVTTLQDMDHVSIGHERAMVLNDSNERVERARVVKPVQGWVSTVCLQRMGDAQGGRPPTGVMAPPPSMPLGQGPGMVPGTMTAFGGPPPQPMATAPYRMPMATAAPMQGYGVSQAAPVAYAPSAAQLGPPQVMPMSMPVSQPVMQGYQTMPTNGIPMAAGIGGSYRTAGVPMQSTLMQAPPIQAGAAPPSALQSVAVQPVQAGAGARPMTNFDMAGAPLPASGQV